MEVKNLSLLCFTVILTLCGGVLAGSRCDTKLLNTFKLRGLETAVEDRMQVCGGVFEKCCSLLDEIRIVQMWKQIAEPNFKKFIVRIGKIYSALFEFHKYFSLLTESDFTVHYLYYQKVPYMQKTCSLSSQRRERRKALSQFQFRNRMFPGDGPIRPYQPRISFSVLDSFVIGEYRRWSSRVFISLFSVFEEQNLFKHTDYYVRTPLFFAPKDPNTQPPAAGTEEKGKGPGFWQKVKQGADHLFGRGLAETPVKEEPSLPKSRLLDEVNSFRFFLGGARKFLRDPTKILHRREFNFSPGGTESATELKAPESTDIAEVEMTPPAPQERGLRELSGGVKLFDLESDHDRKARRLGEILRRKVKRKVKRRVRMKIHGTEDDKAASLLSMGLDSKRVVTPLMKWQNFLATLSPYDRDFFKKNRHSMKKRIRNMVRKRVGKSLQLLSRRLTMPFKLGDPSHLLTRKPVFFESPEDRPYIRCNTEKRKFFKSYLLFNPEKLKYCSDTLQKLRDFPIQELESYFDHRFVSDLTALQDLKKTLYCSICDAKQQKFVISNPKNRVIVFDQEFCSTTLKTFRSYLFWKNYYMVDYLDTLLQLVSCSDTPGNTYAFPFKSIVGWHRRRLESFKKCFDNLEGENFMRECLFICKQYDILSYTQFFEGNFRTLSTIHFKLLDFVRQRLNVTPFHFYKIMKVRDKTQKMALFEEMVKDLAPRSSPKAKRGSLPGTKKKKTVKTRPSFSAKASTNTASDSKSEEKPTPIKKRRFKSKISTAEALLLANPEHQIDLKLNSMIYHSGEEATETRSPIKTYKGPLKEEIFGREIFEKVKTPYSVKRMRSFFSSHKKALQPFRTAGDTNFQIEFVQLLTMQALKTKEEVIKPQVLGEYFRFKHDEISDFNRDLDTQVLSLKDLKDKVQPNENFPSTEPAGDDKKKEEDSTPEFLKAEVSENSNDSSMKLLGEMMHSKKDSL